MYRNYVQKWRLLKRNRIICPEIAVNGQFLTGKLNFFLNCLKKSKFFGNLIEKIRIVFKFAWKNRNFSKICLEKPKFITKFACKNQNFCKKCACKNQNFQKFAWKNRFVKLHEKIEILLTQIDDHPQISNQIDAAGHKRAGSSF